MQEIRNCIDGRMRGASGWLDDVDPATGAVYARVPRSGEPELREAIDAAARAFPEWAATPAQERSQLLRKLARLIERDLEPLARAECIDSGKPLQLARSLDIPRAVQNFDFFADAITQFSSEAHLIGESAINYTLREPLGPVACISPWNLPLYLLSWKIAPALAAGNCVIAKPSEVTPMTASMLGELSIEAGFPPGVLNIVHGYGPEAGGPLCADPRIRAISFTGSTRVGREIARNAAGSFVKTSLELGGKNPTLIFADSDLRKAIPEAVRAAFTNTGQICLCGSRILIERSVYEEVRDALVERVRALRVGDPLEAGTDQGALVSQAHFDKVMHCLSIAREEGGRFLCGGERAIVSGRCAHGFFIQPTLIEGLGPEARTNQEEIFGPVATLLPFSDEAEAVALANSTRYGLSASLFTGDVSRAHRVSARLQAGIVWVNCWLLRDLRTPFGGVKESGVGREGGTDALRFFTEPRNVCVKL